MQGRAPSNARLTSAQARALAPVDAFQGRWRFASLFAAVWLVSLAGVAQDALQVHPRWQGLIGLAALTAFCVLYVQCWTAVRRLREEGRTATARWRAGTIGGACLLFVVTLLCVGESALGMTLFVTVMAMFVLPPMIGAVVTGVMFAAAEILPRSVPGWGGRDDLGLPVLLAALAMFGLVRIVQRNAQLARAQQTIAELAVVQERTRFARDLHDVLGHSLTVLAVKAELAGRLVDLDPERARQEIADVERLAREALSDVRAAVSGYRAVDLRAELAAARVALESAGIKAELPVSVDVVPGERRELAGWVVRESVTNVVRHSGARRCRVTVSEDDVEIVDDGAGPLAEGVTGDGHGLAGLRERAEAAGATLTVGRATKGGFRVRVGWGEG